MTDENLLHDLTGDGVVSVKPKRPRGRPRKDKKPPRAKKPEGVRILDAAMPTEPYADTDGAGGPDLRTEQILKGVTATWFARVLRMDVNSVKARLRHVTPMGNSFRQAVYDLKTALPHLVDPVTDIETFLRNMDPKMMPIQLTSSFWQAEKARMVTMEMASRLWPTEVVLTGYAHIFRILRNDTRLWLDTLDEATPLTDKQRETFGQLIDGMMDSIYLKLQEHTKENATRPELEYLEARLEEVKASSSDFESSKTQNDEDRDPDLAALI